MASALLLPPPLKPNPNSTTSNFLPFRNPMTTNIPLGLAPKRRITISAATSSPSTKPHPPFRPLDRHATTHNRLRFVRKLTTLLLSKPRHFLPLKILSRCRRYLAPTRPLLQMILRYPAIFRLFHIPSHNTPLLCVGLTPHAAALAAQEADIKSRVVDALATKLQKLLMMSSYRRLLLSKIVHIAPDLGLPVDFRSRLCNRCPERFRIVETSYGRALELVEWDPVLAEPITMPEKESRPEHRPIIDRPPKFKQLILRKGLNLKRRHRDYLLRFKELPTRSPYSPYTEALEAGLAEKRACAVVKEVLAMTVERRTLVDHLTHFRKEMGLPNKLRGLLVRHPEIFYISLKGKRDSVFLVDGYDDKGRLVEKDELLAAKDRLLELVREGKRMRRERRKDTTYGDEDENEMEEEVDGSWIDDVDDEDGDLEDLFETGIRDDWEEFSGINDVNLELEEGGIEDIEAFEFWSTKGGISGTQLGELKVW